MKSVAKAAVVGQQRTAGWRRDLGRAITAQAQSTVQQLLDNAPTLSGKARRIAITGAPGVGKSTVIANLVERLAGQGRRVGILAIDPTSPISSGSLLGDRIRMDAITSHDNVYMRSLPSRADNDGLCHNVLGILGCFEDVGFDDIILETVGVGQMNYGALDITDCFVLVLSPGAGDIIQAMKAGIMELADVYVLNKADQPDAARTASELRAMCDWRKDGTHRRPALVMTANNDVRGFAELDAALKEHFDDFAASGDAAARHKRRRHFLLRSLLNQQLTELSGREAMTNADPRAALAFLASHLSNAHL
jgi:LAO/AO transport system kinase